MGIFAPEYVYIVVIKPTNPKYDFWYWKYGLDHSKKKCNIQLSLSKLITSQRYI